MDNFIQFIKHYLKEFVTGSVLGGLAGGNWIFSPSYGGNLAGIIGSHHWQEVVDFIIRTIGVCLIAFISGCFSVVATLICTDIYKWAKNKIYKWYIKVFKSKKHGKQKSDTKDKEAA